jgi:hypothetical protein
MAKVSKRQQQAVFVSYAVMSQFVDQALALINKHKPAKQDIRKWWLDYWENSTPVRGQRTSRIRFWDLAGGQPKLDAIMQEVVNLAKQELPAGSWILRSWRTGSAPMQGSWKVNLKRNVFTVYYKSKHEGPHWKHA